jgi:hypothetical protein
MRGPSNAFNIHKNPMNAQKCKQCLKNKNLSTSQPSFYPMGNGPSFLQGSGWSMKLTIHLHPANMRNALRYTSNLPFVFIMLHLIKQGDNFGFALLFPKIWVATQRKTNKINTAQHLSWLSRVNEYREHEPILQVYSCITDWANIKHEPILQVYSCITDWANIKEKRKMAPKMMGEWR